MELRAYLPHVFAAVVGMTYAWFVSQSQFVATGLMFVAPAVVLIFAHLAWLLGASGWHSKIGRMAMQRASLTALGLFGVVTIGSLSAPMPAQSNAGDFGYMVLGVLFCLAVLAGVVALVVFVFFLLLKGLSVIFGGRSGKDRDSQLWDVGSFVAAIALLSLASLEGVPGAYHFERAGVSTASRVIDATQEDVWDTLGTATSPSFALPRALHAFPQPVAVEVDEGVALGARRVVRITGREGDGHLSLEVVARTDKLARFKVLSDTSAISNWVAHKSLTYQVVPTNAGTRLDVTLRFDRLLAPSVVFGPLSHWAAVLAMDVLARDVEQRAEAG